MKTTHFAFLAVGILVIITLFNHHVATEHIDDVEYTEHIEADLAKLMRKQRRTEEKLDRLTVALERLQGGPAKLPAAPKRMRRHGSTSTTAAAAATTTTAATPDESDRQAASVSHAVAEPDLNPDCPNRSPYHTVLTAQSSTYQQWQSRIMYFHWKKQAAAAGPCTEMVGFTRLTATEGGKPDGLEAEIPSVFTVELSKEVLDAHFSFGVLNRPNSVRQLLGSAEMRAALKSPFVLLCETDHVFMRPLPNFATHTSPAAWVFGYMHANPAQTPTIQKHWPEGSHSDLQPVGPSPLQIHIDQLEQLTPRWMEFSLGLRSNADAEAVMQGWVQEMWGYSIAAASHGIRHRLVPEMMIEASSLTRRVRRSAPGPRPARAHLCPVPRPAQHLPNVAGRPGLPREALPVPLHLR